MICNFIVTIVLMTSPPTPRNTQGVLEVKQYHFQTFLKANDYAQRNLLGMGAGLNSKSKPSIESVELTKTEPFECN